MTAALTGTPIAGDIAYGPDGNLTNDPKEALNGALRVFDRGHKGSGLALMIELLAGALSGAAMSDKKASANWGSLVIVIDPGIFGDAESVRERLCEMCHRVKNAKKLQETREMFLPVRNFKSRN